MLRYALLPVLLLGSGVARAECTEEDRTDMLQMGMSNEEIVTLCRIRPEAGGTPDEDRAYYCATADGYCPLARATTPGRDCSCDTAYGPVSGVAE